MFTLSASKFSEMHKCYRAHLIDYLTRGSNRSRLGNPNLISWLHDGAAEELNINNITARITLTELLVQLLSNRLAKRGVGEISMFTAADDAHAEPVERQRAMDIDAVVRWARRLLRNSHCIGVVEPAYYGNIRSVDGHPCPMISWHFHSIVWGTEPAKLWKLRDVVNRERQAFVPGAAAAHVTTFSAGQVAHRMRYILKAPTKEYRIYPLKKEFIDKETGEIVVGSTNRFRQKKREMRPGDAIRMMQRIGHLTLPDLLFAVGDGQPLLEEALQETQAKMKADKALSLRSLRRALG